MSPRRPGIRFLVIVAIIGTLVLFSAISSFTSLLGNAANISAIIGLYLAYAHRNPRPASHKRGKHARTAGQSQHQFPKEPRNIDHAREFYEAGHYYRQNLEAVKARTAFESAARFGHRDASYQYAMMSSKIDPQALIYLKRAIKSGHCQSYEYLCDLMQESGDIDGLIEMSKVFAADTDIPKITASGPPPGVDEAEVKLRRRATAGDPAAMNDLAALLWKTGSREQARRWYERAEQEQLRRSAPENLKRTKHGPLPDKDATEPHPDEHEAASWRSKGTSNGSCG